MYKKIIFLIIIMVLVSCTNNKIIKKEIIKKTPIVTYNLKINNFPKKELILNDINIIAYINYNKLSKIKYLKNITKLLNKNYLLKNVKNFYLTLSDFYKSQELLIFLNHFNIDINDSNLKKENIRNKIIIKTYDTDNQEFGFINFRNSAIYGDTSLIKELFDIYDKKVKSISKNRYQKIISSNFIKSLADIKILFIPNLDYKKMILEFSNKQLIFKTFIKNFNYLLISINFIRDNEINLSFKINFKEDEANNLFNFLNTQKKLLFTLNGTASSTINSNKILKNISLLNKIKIKRIDNSNLSIKIKIKKNNFNSLIKLSKRIIEGINK